MFCMNEVYELDIFSETLQTLEPVERAWIEKIKDQLKDDLFVGKPLRYEWLREKRYNNKRIYYLINPMTRKALIVAFGSKKEQQQIIDSVIGGKEYLLALIR